ncbi:MAG TPA: extracellular solute-binding protein [Mycobacteriales bacterium]
MRTRCRRVLGGLLAAGLALGPAGCGGGAGPPTLTWFAGLEPSGSFEAAAQACADASGGRYRIRLETLPRASDRQRRELVRRLAAGDETIDLMGMDVIWTAEFAAAGWVRPWDAGPAARVSAGVLSGPLRTARYGGRLWAAPLTSNTQLLWYRRSLVREPPATWDAMIAAAEALPEGRNRVQVQAGQQEAYTTWVNSLLASAGTGLVAHADDPGRAAPALAPGPAETALRVIRRLADSPAADPALPISDNDTTALAVQSGSSAFALAYPAIWPSTRVAAPDVYADLGWARWPAVVPGRPSRPPLGGLNLGVSTFSRHPAEAFEAAACLRDASHQVRYAVDGGLPPTLDALYGDPDVVRRYPFAELLRRSIEEAAPRPATPAYADVSLAVRSVLHPPAGLDPAAAVPELRDRIGQALRSEALL